MNIQVEIGEKYRFSKTVGESDVYLFAGITGDLSPHHVNDAYMKASTYGQRIAHGALMVGFMSTAAGMAIAKTNDEFSGTVVSLGYDRIRFLEPVFIGDTIVVDYEISSIDVDKGRSYADIRITNQRDVLVSVGVHILKWVPEQSHGGQRA